MTLVLTDARVLLPGQVLEHGWVQVDDATITEVGDGTPPAGEHVDLAGAWLAPGFVDMHIHGGGGASFQGGDPDDVARVVRTHRRHGTTTMMASLVTRPVAELVESIARLSDLVADGVVAGVHLEGPFLSARRCGAHDPAYLVPPEPAVVDRLVAACRDVPTMVTVAPELDGGLEAVRRLADAGAVVAVGHTDATYDRARRAVDAGARVATHLYNAMPPAHHRHPGPVPALLEDERVVVELIEDREHLHDAVFRAAVRAAGPQRTALVSDGIAATGLGDGDYMLGGLQVQVRAGAARLAGRDSLAGSTVTVGQAVRNAVANGVRVADAVTSASLTPARALSLQDRVGSIGVGLAADLVVLDADLRATAVMTGGRWVHQDDAR